MRIALEQRLDAVPPSGRPRPQHLQHALARAPRHRVAAVQREPFADDLLDRQARRKRANGSWNTTCISGAACGGSAPVGIVERLPSMTRSRRCAAARGRACAMRERRLARARLANDAERLARSEIEVDVVHRGEAPAPEPAADARQRRRIVDVDVAPPARAPLARRLHRALAAGFRPAFAYRGAAARSNTSAVRPCSTITPFSITATRSAKRRTRFRSCVMSSSAMPPCACSSLQQRRGSAPDGHVERRGRLVGDQQPRIARERHGDHRALALAAGELVRIAVACGARPPGCRCARSSSTARLAPAFARAAPSCSSSDLHDLVADRVERIERGHRLLEDHRDVAAAHAVHRALRLRQHLAAVEPDRAGRLRVLDETQDRQRRHRLARPRLADQRELLARIDRERDVVDHLRWPKWMLGFKQVALSPLLAVRRSRSGGSGFENQPPARSHRFLRERCSFVSSAPSAGRARRAAHRR